MIIQGIGQVKLICTNGKKKSAIPVWNSVLYILVAGVNFISQGQIYGECFCHFTIVEDRIYIGNSGLFANFLPNNLYIIDIVRLFTIAFASINKETLQA